jgi:hypothetical protein
MHTLFPVPIKTALHVEPARVLEFIACFTGMPNPMKRDLDEFQVFYEIQRPLTDFYRFRPSSVYVNAKNFLLRGMWRDRTTDAGESWEDGCLLVTRDTQAIFYAAAELYSPEDFVPLQSRPR